MLDRVAEYYQDNVDRAFDASRSKMFQLARTGVILIAGVMLLVMTKNYFAGQFEWVDKFFGTE